MARVTHVAKAQARYETVPVIDPETNEPKRVPVMKGDRQKVSKRGPVFMTVTRQDRTKPLPPEECDSCGEAIEVGTPYKWVKPKSGPYGGRKRSRHESCPSWKVWELSNSWSARIAQALDGVDLSAVDTLESPDDAQSILDDAASVIRGLASESQEAADSIESGFGHSTYQSEEATERADSLESWADEIEGVDIPELPEPAEDDCSECGGTGKVSADDGSEPECDECEGSGQVTPDDPTDEQMDEWRDEVRDAIQEALDNCPV